MQRSRRERRKINKEWEKVFNDMRRNSAKYGDKHARIETIEMFEDLDDKPADLIVCCDILEHLPDVDAALKKINTLAIKGVLITVQCDAVRDEEAWRRIIEKRMTIIDWLCEDGRISATCSTGMRIEGAKIVAAGGTDDDRWDAIEAGVKRTSKRIPLAEAHERRAIIACYGPSLKFYWPALKEEVDAGGDLISVSGSHDFLIEHGMVPRFHIEADPRPHKAVNIQPHPDVQYLIASSCHPDLFDKLEDHDVALWHVSTNNHAIRLVDQLKENKDTIVSGGGSVGVRSIPLLYGLGYRKYSIYGMDCSFEEADGTYNQWAGKHAGKKQPITTARCGDRDFPTSPVLIGYAGNFFDTIQRLPDARFAVYGDGLLQAMCRLYWKHTQLEAA